MEIERSPFGFTYRNIIVIHIGGMENETENNDNCGDSVFRVFMCRYSGYCFLAAVWRKNREKKYRENRGLLHRNAGKRGNLAAAG